MSAELAEQLGDLSLCEIADLIGEGKVSAVETLEATFQRIDERDPVHHAFVWQDREAALARAAWLDRARTSAGTTGPLHGVPLAHKDLLYRSGRASACGSLIRRNEKADFTATVLRNLDDAGALDVGGLAMVEFAMGPHGYNAHLPRALNPWGHQYIPCGSSSGSGVAVAARMVYGSVGSDTGGSVRLPAAVTGLVGLLPTISLLSSHGMMPMSWSLDSAGPLTRTVRDAARMLTAMAGGGGPAEDYEVGLERSVSGLRIGVAEGYFDEDVHPDVQATVAASLDVLRHCGATIVPVRIPDSMAVASALHPLVMKAEGSANHRVWKRANAGQYSDEVGKRLEAGFFILASDYINAMQYRSFALEDFLDNVLSEMDVLHTAVMPMPTPTLEDTAYRDGPAYLKMVVNLTRNTRPVNFLGLPALSVTCGYTSNGMPTSFQLLGRPFSEAMLLRLGHRYQQETHWHTDVPTMLRKTAPA